MTIVLILNIAVSTLVFAGVVGSLVWSIATQRRDLAGAGWASGARAGIKSIRQHALANQVTRRAAGRQTTALARGNEESHSPRAACWFDPLAAAGAALCDAFGSRSLMRVAVVASDS